jgi:hypothetical protein
MNLFKKLFGRKKPEPANAAVTHALWEGVYSFGEPIGVIVGTSSQCVVEGNTFNYEPCEIVGVSDAGEEQL